MKKALQLVLLFLPLAAILTISSCGPKDDPVPGVDFTTVTVTNDFPMDINSFHYEITVYRYREFSYATEYRFYSGDLDVNNPTISNIDIPPHTAYQISVRLFSNDCSLVCAGSCVQPPFVTGGYPEYYKSVDNLTGVGEVETFIELPYVSCN